jgi:hypothetical protein
VNILHGNRLPIYPVHDLQPGLRVLIVYYTLIHGKLKCVEFSMAYYIRL